MASIVDSRALLDWYDRNKRKMPWRDQVSPYRTWVSEVMLQQTQVDVVRGYFERFMQHFPDVQALAHAEESAVLAAWAGLGYYSRARNLHKAAKRMVTEHGGEPANAMDWAELPGIGRYTLGAIRSIAYGEPLPVVDGNVLRVYARLLALPVRRGDAKDEKRIWALAEPLVPQDRPGDFNQALMELGATVCTQESPNCLLCPMRQTCRQAVEYPLPKVAPKRKRMHLELAWVEREGRVLMVQRPKPGLWAGMAALPEIGPGLIKREHLATVERALTHRDVVLSLYRCEGSVPGVWAARDALAQMPAAFAALINAVDQPPAAR